MVYLYRLVEIDFSKEKKGWMGMCVILSVMLRTLMVVGVLVRRDELNCGEKSRWEVKKKKEEEGRLLEKFGRGWWGV
jgi:hypothetical protein